jgi:coproporphyrinogen III oxidase-like Fe-S oxidoreductase
LTTVSDGGTTILTSLLRIWLTRSFKPFTFKGGVSDWPEVDNLKSPGLYVHIPFCRSICSFCPYYKTIYNETQAEAYLQSLLREIELTGSSLKTKKGVSSLYFGGGTPALMSHKLKDIIDKINIYFELEEGIGVELHPTDLKEETLAHLKEAGVNMVSLGIQSFSSNCLDTLGRKQTDIKAGMELLGKYAFDVIDADLIFALPGQKVDMLISDIETAFSCGATQVSTYPYIDFGLPENRYKPQTEKVKRHMLKAINDYCKSNQVTRTSVWTYAQVGTKKYSSVTRESFLGFGASAATLLSNQFRLNTFSVEAYIERLKNDKTPTALKLSFTSRQRAVYYLFWSIYGLNINPEEFNKIWGFSLDDMYGLELWLAARAGLLKRNNGTYSLTEKGAYRYHQIEQAYTHAYISKMWKEAADTPFPAEIILR